jgi:hypothetical protein
MWLSAYWGTGGVVLLGGSRRMRDENLYIAMFIADNGGGNFPWR